MILRHQSPASIRAPFGRYVHMVEVAEAGRLLFLSGQLGIDQAHRAAALVGMQAAMPRQAVAAALLHDRL